MTKATKNDVHHLRYLWHEDEAQTTGLAFQNQDNGNVLVWNTFWGYPEWEADSERILSRKQAIALWRKCLASGDYERTN